jgi:hypothetical protein
MEKKHIIQFLKEKKRGVYTVLVEIYADVITSMATTMALAVIKEDLEKESEATVEINYFSLAKAASKFRRANKSKAVGKKWNFRDASEIPEDQSVPGKFKIS